MREKMALLDAHLKALDEAPIHKKERAARQAVAVQVELMREMVEEMEKSKQRRALASRLALKLMESAPPAVRLEVQFQMNKAAPGLFDQVVEILTEDAEEGV